MSMIQAGKVYPKIKCDKCSVLVKSYALYTIPTIAEAEHSGLEIGQCICMNCSLDLPLSKEEEAAEARYKALEVEREEEYKIHHAERMKLINDPKWNKQLEASMMRKMQKSMYLSDDVIEKLDGLREKKVKRV